ncbi:MAG: hypothetical protein D6698_17605 [Gammaproteobacteria bacterium]|nr:MAG: hypothetical protein D6698_17605 [Gammaproteobacteria bacterium]
MAVTAGRTGFQQTLAGGLETIFDAYNYSSSQDSNGNVHGSPLKGVEITAHSQDLLVYIHGLNTVTDGSDGTSTVIAERVPAGSTIQRYAYEGRSGLINKIEVDDTGVPGEVSWAPLMV